MNKLVNLKPENVFKYFSELSSIPRGSGNMKDISLYCIEFAKKHGLKAVQDKYLNVVIYKKAAKGYENSEPIILQGHLDMVCQKDDGYFFDFSKDSLKLYTENGFLKAEGTTLGADNGIAVAMILAILEDDTLEHPPIEAVFTTDEEIGMLGAMKLDVSKLSSTKMINLDSEDEGIVTVSCAGGSDFFVSVPIAKKKSKGTEMRLIVKGLRGGHSGVEINSGRVNANVLIARILNRVRECKGFSLIRVDGGSKGNAIPLRSTANFLVDDPEKTCDILNDYIKVIKNEIVAREPGFDAEIEILGENCYDVMTPEFSKKIIYVLMCAPNGVIEMSAEIKGLVESSLNMGILKTEEDKVTILFTLRSNKKSMLNFIEEKLKMFFSCVVCEIKTSGHYPPWEYKSDSYLQTIYSKEFEKKFGYKPTFEALHAGLECGVFASAIDKFDCISVGPQMYDVHTTKEKLDILSVEKVFDVLCNVLKTCR